MRGPTFLDLFSGAGGLSFGLQSAGWTPLLAIDCWRDAAATYRWNQPGHPIWETDVATIQRRDLYRRLEAQPDWVVGGPPCQGFSTVGKRLREDPRNGLFLHFANVVKDFRPSGFILENVLGLKDMRFAEHVQSVFEDLGYRVAFHVLTAADYGVPQLRRRVVFVGHRERGIFLGPERTHFPGKHVTVWDAIGDLPSLEPGQTAASYTAPAATSYQRLMREGSTSLQGHTASQHPHRLVEAIAHIPDGGNRRDIPAEFQPRSGFHNSYSRLSSRAPAVAVTSNMSKPSATRCIHPFQHRGLTAREGARLQSFPDRYHFLGGHVSQRLQVANAVPPLLANALGKAILTPERWTADPPGQCEFAFERARCYDLVGV